MIDLFPGLELFAYFALWALLTFIVLYFWDWCTDDSQGEKE